jgi:HlyD family secretion protein
MNAKRSVLINSAVTTRNTFTLQSPSAPSAGSTIRKGKNFSRGRWMVIGMAFAVGGGVALAGVRLATSKLKIPTALVKRGEFMDYVQLRGEISAFKSVTIAAPTAAGDLQIIKLAPNGTRVERGDVVAQFDTSKLSEDLARQRSALKQAEAEIEQVRTEAYLKEEQDQTALARARYELEAAKLEASKQEILSKIEGEEAKLKVADAEQELREAEEKVKSDRAAAAADLQGEQEKRDKALSEVGQAERNISGMTLKAPADGMVTLVLNWRPSDPSGGRSEFKEGDRAWAGAAIAELPDLATLRVSARVDEADRGRLRPGQPAIVRVDALPDREVAGHVLRINTLATTDFDAGWPFVRNFDVEIELDQTDSRLRPGMRAMARVEVDRFSNSILIPADASFQKSGRSVAYVLRGSKFEERPVEIARRGEGQLLVDSGLSPGERVALKDLTEKQ